MLRPCYIPVLTWFVILVVKSEKLLPGHCPPVTSMAEFNRDLYMGVWYQQATIKAILKDDVTCTLFLYKPISGGGFQMEAQKVARLTNGAVSVYGVAELSKNNKTPGSYKVTYFGDLVNEVSNYYILHTDYTSISVVWSCDPFYNFWNRQNIQVLTRSRTMNTTSLLVSTLRALLPNHLDHLFDYINPVDQTECEEIVSF